MYKSLVTAATAMNATETTKTLIDTVTVPQGVRALVGVGVQFLGGTAGLTTLENVGGICELESDDMAPWGGTQQFLTGAVAVLTSGVGVIPPYIHPTNIPVTAGAHIKVSCTMDIATTVNNKCRAQLVFE